MQEELRDQRAPATQPRPPRFIVLEGLSASGKSTVAALLAKLLGAESITPDYPGFNLLRRHIDGTENVNTRLHFWVSENYARSDSARRVLDSGRSVVTESYFYRTLATHTAMGAQTLPGIDWNAALTPHATYLLRVNEKTRRARLTARGRPDRTGYWSQLEEEHIHLTETVYQGFGLIPIDIGNATADEVARLIADLETTALRLPRQGHPPR